MPRPFVLPPVIAALALGAFAWMAPEQAQQPPGAADRSASVERGRYLANSVAMCVQCHSPRDQHGNVLDRQKFRGAPMPVRSPYPEQPFAFHAPNIAGLPGFTDEQFVSLLTTGRTGDRPPPQPPMPPFRMSREDAEAILAYLRSL